MALGYFRIGMSSHAIQNAVLMAAVLLVQHYSFYSITSSLKKHNLIALEMALSDYSFSVFCSKYRLCMHCSLELPHQKDKTDCGYPQSMFYSKRGIKKIPCLLPHPSPAHPPTFISFLHFIKSIMGRYVYNVNNPLDTASIPLNNTMFLLIKLFAY